MFKSGMNKTNRTSENIVLHAVKADFQERIHNNIAGGDKFQVQTISFELYSLLNFVFEQ